MTTTKEQRAEWRRLAEATGSDFIVATRDNFLALLDELEALEHALEDERTERAMALAWAHDERDRANAAEGSNS